jgi:hypothetical protein
MSVEIEGHVFWDECSKCGISRKEYDDSRKPNPCRGYRNLKIPDNELGEQAVNSRLDRIPIK